MKEHLSEQSIDRYRLRAMKPAELLAADEHFANCVECHQRIGDSAHLNAAIDSLVTDFEETGRPADDHLTYEQLEAYVDNEQDAVDREIAAVHLEVCRQCTEELQGLQELAKSLPTSKPERIALKSPKQSLWGWRFDRLTWPRMAIAALVVLTAAALVWTIRRSSSQPTKEVAESSGPAVSASPAPSTADNASPVQSPRILVTLNDAGGKITLDDTGKIEGLSELSPALNGSVKTALTTERLNIGPALAGLKEQSGTQMGTSHEGLPFRLLEPVGVVVLGDRPTLRWEPLKGASTYVVKVFDTNFNEVATSAAQLAPFWRVATPLRRGVAYTWNVTAIKDGEEIKSPTAPAPEARFKVMSLDREAEIERVQRTHPNSHLILGTLYAEAGLLKDAQREFRLLLRANPGSPVAQKLLQQVSKPFESGTR